MTKTTDKRGAGRGKTPAKPGTDKGASGKGAKGDTAPAKAAAKRTPAAGKAKAGALPAWMPDPGLLRAMKPRGPEATSAGGAAPATPAGEKTTPARPGTAKRKRGGAGVEDPQAAREAGRYENPIPSREAILQVLTDADGPLDAEALQQVLGLAEPERAIALDKRLAAMVRDGQILKNRRSGFVPAAKADLIPGTVIANPEGFGFLRPENGVGDDLFLPPFEMRKVMHGDRVLGSVTGVDRRGRREGVIVEVLERRVSRLIGRFAIESGISFVVPDDRRIQRNVQIPTDARQDARDGQLVVCEIVAPPDNHRPPIGRVLAVLGDRLTASIAVEAAIHGHDIPHEFPAEVLDAASAVPVDVEAREVQGRLDLRKLALVTIDGEDAKDFDDAVYCEPNRDGFRLIVAIADVAHYVRPDEPLDVEAQKRATSVYFPGYVVPMLPETLSNGICSLKPKVDRLCFACDMQVDRRGNVVSYSFHEAVMHSHARLTYNQVWNAVGDGVPDADRDAAQAFIGAQMPQVLQLHQLFKVLEKARQQRGAIDFETSEVRFVLGPQGEVTQAGMIQRNDAHKLIEECMISANVAAAHALLASAIPAPFRDHDRPPEGKYADLLEFLKEFQLRLPTWAKVRPRDFRKLLETVRERPDAALLESVLLRSQSLAVYSPDNIGHFGLALEAYAHFTSPIRRYADLLVHRAIKHALIGGSAAQYKYTAHQMATLSLQCSERSRRADEAQREVDERYRAAWMEEHVGREFDGVVSGVTSFGLFIELDESKVNGLVHVTQLPNDFYHFDPIRKTLTGQRSEREYRLGDRVRIVVLKASVEDLKIDFRLVEEGQRQKGEPNPPAPRGQPAKRSKKKY
ncbi:ribonuclease R [Luteimonas terricola]|uniref:Ribonuclease R n=1 Tax=Luteimonas terricola TaxID=645597 RepID=A0ABQ2ECQ0_9GAMM|nr:ribonuclease R [Luteimonas terricola]GGK06934.1 ribonuclease R [Luteimonas terricola]